MTVLSVVLSPLLMYNTNLSVLASLIPSSQTTVNVQCIYRLGPFSCPFCIFLRRDEKEHNRISTFCTRHRCMRGDHYGYVLKQNSRLDNQIAL